MKRYIFLIGLFMIVTVAFSFAEESIFKYSYESAFEAAVNNSIQPALDDYNIKSKESTLKEAQKEYELEAAKKGLYSANCNQLY